MVTIVDNSIVQLKFAKTKTSIKEILSKCIGL